MSAEEEGNIMEIDGRQIEVSNLDKILFPDAGITKGVAPSAWSATQTASRR